MPKSIGMSNKRFVAKQRKMAMGSDDAEMTGAGMNTTPEYKHPRGNGGAGGSPVKFRKREGGLEDSRVIHGENCKSDMDKEVAKKGIPENFD